MFPIFYRILIIISCILLINTYPLKINSNHRYLPYDTMNDGIFGLERVESNRFLPSNPHIEMLSKKRQSFGRKHHWDSFFG